VRGRGRGRDRHLQRLPPARCHPSQGGSMSFATVIIDFIALLVAVSLLVNL
jgi:hypothetical protein